MIWCKGVHILICECSPFLMYIKSLSNFCCNTDQYNISAGNICKVSFTFLSVVFKYSSIFCFANAIIICFQPTAALFISGTVQ